MTASPNVQVFNGPRAGVLWNDGFGGGNTLQHSLLFNLVRETTDHGPCVVPPCFLLRIDHSELCQGYSDPFLSPTTYLTLC
jgi:hypothetical protein